MINVEEIITEFYPRSSKIYDVLMEHGMQVARKAIDILYSMPILLDVDIDFLVEASILHDIGYYKVCKKNNGVLFYLCHGFEGRKMLNKINLPKHGLVCERHIGVGLMASDIIKLSLPLPIKNMIPISFEEKLICYSDKFFSKINCCIEKNINDLYKDIAEYGEKKLLFFMRLHNYFTGRNKYNI